MYFRKSLSIFLIAGLLVEKGHGSAGWACLGSHASALSDGGGRLDDQAMNLPGLLWRHSLSLQAKVREHRAAQVQRIEALGGSAGLTNLHIVGWPWVSVDYLEALYQVLLLAKDDPVHYDFSQIQRIRFVPWWASFGRMESDGGIVAVAQTVEEIVLVAHWHPRVFLRELTYKMTRAARRADNLAVIAEQSWTSAADSSSSAKGLYARLASWAFLTGILAWLAAPLAWPGQGRLAQALLAAGALALQGYSSYIKHGVIAQALALARGRPERGLDPAKPTPLLPPSSLDSPDKYAIDQAAGELSHPTAMRLSSRPAALVFSYGVHAAILLAAIALEKVWVALVAIALVLGWSLFMTAFRLLLLPSSAPDLHVPGGPVRRLILAFGRQALRLVETLRFNLKWGVPLLLAIALISPTSRMDLLDKLRQTDEDIKELLEKPIEELHEYRVLPLYNPHGPESLIPGQGGQSLLPGSRVVNRDQREAETKIRSVPPIEEPAIPPRLSVPLEKAPAPTPVVPDLPSQQGMGSRTVFVWEQPYVYSRPDNAPGDRVVDPFQLSREQAAHYKSFFSEIEKSIDGNVRGVRLNIRRSDHGKFHVFVMYWSADQRSLMKGYDFDLPDHTADQPLLPIDVPFDDANYERTHTSVPPHLTVSISGEQNKGASMRVQVNDMTTLTGPERPGQQYHSGPYVRFTDTGDDGIILFGSMREMHENKLRARAARIARNRLYLLSVPEGASVPVYLYIDPITDSPQTKIVTKQELERMVERGEVDYSIPTGQWIWNVVPDMGRLLQPANPAFPRRDAPLGPTPVRALEWAS